MKHHRTLDILLSGILAVIAFQFTYIWAALSSTYLHDVALSQEDRPYVYRALLPFLARGLSWLTEFEPGTSLLLLFVVSAVGLYFAVKYLYTTFYPDDLRARLIAVLGCLATDLLIVVMPHPYDVATAVFFTLALAFLARRQFLYFYLLFPIATLNRETTFLLTIFFAIHFFRRLSWSHYIVAGVYQVAAYSAIKIFVERMFADRPGETFSWNVTRNMVAFGRFPWVTVFLLALLLLTLWLVWRGWPTKPVFLRRAFLVIFPLQLLLYFSLGGHIEMRVFAEFFPALFLLALPVLPSAAPAVAVSTVTPTNQYKNLESL